MKWKTALTAEEAALFAVGLEGYKSIRSAGDFYSMTEPRPMTNAEALDTSTRWEIESSEREELCSNINTAKDIYEALLEDVILADPYEGFYAVGTSILEIVFRCPMSLDENYMDAQRTTVSKLSLAKWFWQHDQSIAKKFWPTITEELVYPPQPKSVMHAGSTDISSKTKNSYLKTIRALSDALVDGLTGKPNTDAEAILAALASKKVEAPIGSKALSKYLEEANGL